MQRVASLRSGLDTTSRLLSDYSTPVQEASNKYLGGGCVGIVRMGKQG
jgi:hypothetical protein